VSPSAPPTLLDRSSGEVGCCARIKYGWSSILGDLEPEDGSVDLRSGEVDSRGEEEVVDVVASSWSGWH
jgi:hypothetical protein